ncbi:hypothetical protein G9A89_010480 [Geosiphon pyriformis]|nr:hypothetical protein G9A89_010480 [Geosiphon pyriformis]
MFTANITTLLNRIPFQSKQKKAKLQNQNNPNITPIVLQNLFSIIVIDLPPVLPIVEQQQQLLLPPQQQLQQQSQPPQQQQQVVTSMAYISIAKLEKNTGKKDNAQVWLNDVTKAITANN